MKQAIGIIGFLLVLVLWATAAVPPQCAMCQAELGQKAYLFANPYLPEKPQPVCGDCAQRPPCSICTFPVHNPRVKFEDGRLLCAQDAKDAVLRPADLENVFREVKSDLFKMLAGNVLPDKNISIELVTRAQLDYLVRAVKGTHDKNPAMGLTQTRHKDGQFEHRIHVLIGLRKSRAAAVCAHEYTHAWLHENLTGGRILNNDTVEGFCELVALKLMTDRGETVERKAILDNTYTAGQIHSFVKAEDRYRFYEVVKWIKEGVDAHVDGRQTDRVLVRNRPEALPAAWQSVKATTVPDTLILRGISGTPQRRFALVNDATLQKGEEAKVRVGTSNVVVRCVEISDASVTLSIQGNSEPTRLFLKQ